MSLEERKVRKKKGSIPRARKQNFWIFSSRSRSDELVNQSQILYFLNKPSREVLPTLLSAVSIPALSLSNSSCAESFCWSAAFFCIISASRCWTVLWRFFPISSPTRSYRLRYAFFDFYSNSSIFIIRSSLPLSADLNSDRAVCKADCFISRILSSFKFSTQTKGRFATLWFKDATLRSLAISWACSSTLRSRA